MADSLITKQALAAALKELLKQKSFEKISINELCSQCNMHRLSFYYHFQDKQELVIWIFDTEFSRIRDARIYQVDWLFTYDICTYLYANRDFYRKVMKLNGCNSLYEHIVSTYYSEIQKWAKEMKGDTTDLTEDVMTFLADIVVSAVRRWIINKDCVTPIAFLEGLAIKYNYIRIFALNDEEFEALGRWSVRRLKQEMPPMPEGEAPEK